MPYIAYHKRNNKIITRKNASSNRLVIFSLGLLIGVSLSLGGLLVIKFPKNLINFKTQNLTNHKNHPKLDLKQSSLNTSNSTSTQGNAVNHNHTYDFYNLLNNAENSSSQKSRSSKQLATSYKLFLQLGMFQDPQAADALKAKLALNGFEAWIEEPSIPNKHKNKFKQYLVKLGPFANLEAANSKKTQLLAAGFTTILVKKSIEPQNHSISKREP